MNPKNRVELLRSKINLRHPMYGWLRVDYRTGKEVEESRLLVKKPRSAAGRLAQLLQMARRA